MSGGRRRTVCIGSLLAVVRQATATRFQEESYGHVSSRLMLRRWALGDLVDLNTCRDEGQVESDVSDSDGSDGTDSSMKTEDMPSEVASQLL